MSPELGEIRPRHALGGLLWFIIIVPPALGFWLVAGELAGVEPGQTHALLVASLFAVGLASLTQVTAGYRLAVFEGPAGNYLAAIAVLAVTSPTPAEATGGLLAAAALVLVLGAVGAHRLLGGLFTAPVVQTFLFVIVVVASPPTIERAIGIAPGSPVGTAEAWISSAVVVGLAVALTLRAASRAWALATALAGGAATYFALSGAPQVEFNSALVSAPEVLPWGAPEISVGVAAPFLVAGLVASFNTVGSIRAMADETGQELDRGAGRRGLLAHGGTLGIGAIAGNVLGHVPRLDSVGIVRLIGTAERWALALAAAAIIAIAFVGPAIELLALVPTPVSAAMVAVVLGVLVVQGVQSSFRLSRRTRRYVIAPAVVPAVLWVAFAGELSATAQLVTNPLLLCVGLAIALDRLVPHGVESEPLKSEHVEERPPDVQ